MKKILLVYIFLFFNINISLFADEEKCGTFDLKCKSKKFVEDTKKFQNEGLEKSKDQIKRGKDKIKDLNPLKKK
jgi:hypothetical protein